MQGRPRKRFGQHFLSDQTIVQHIVSTLAPKTTDHLVEIGPGQGALTVPVLKMVHALEAVELDRDLIVELKSRTGQLGQLIIHSADALSFNFRSLKKDDRKLRIFGNLPYNISTPLLFHLISQADVINDMLFMLQKEVAARLSAPAGSAAYGRLSVMVQYYCQVELLFPVPADAFYPPPQVESNMVRIVPYTIKPFVARNSQQLQDIVRLAFGQRRKTLRNSLKKIITDAQWEQIGLRSDVRAETLTVEDFVILSNAIPSVF